jgi:RNA polymerase sigma-70 factor, ECF subfamily
MAAKGTPRRPLGAPLDDASLEEGFRDHRDSVFRFLLRRTRHAERAEDLTQQVFLEAARDRPRIGAGEPPLLAWLYTVARRRYLDEKDRPVPASLAESEVAATDDALQYGRQVAYAIRVGMQRLSPEHRDVLSRRLLEGVPFAELAARYGMTEGAVKMRFTRGLAELQRELARLGVERR